MPAMVVGENAWSGKVDKNGRVTIPAAARDKLGLEKESDITIFLVENKLEIIRGKLLVGEREEWPNGERTDSTSEE